MEIQNDFSFSSDYHSRFKHLMFDKHGAITASWKEKRSFLKTKEKEEERKCM